MKIGIYCRGFMGWGGGLDFLRIIVQSLICASRSGLDLDIILTDRGFRYNFHRRKTECVRLVKRYILQNEVSSLVHGRAEKLLRDTLGNANRSIQYQHIGLSGRSLLSLCRKRGIDALIPVCLPLGRAYPVPWVGYMADFQHGHFPQNFTKEALRNRAKADAKMCAEARVIIVNAADVATDIKRFFPNTTASVFALPFAAAPEPSWLEPAAHLVEKYNLTPLYFMISNQFWIHKRHDVAFSAMERVLAVRPDVSLVCTGDTDDARRPEYFPSLQAQLDRAGIRDRVRILGLIPKREQIEIMKGAVAVVQPTGFEGGPGGGSVYDAVSVGTPTIVSDIPVNKEIEPLVWKYTPYGDADALAAAMLTILADPPERASTEVLLAQGAARRRLCGDLILRAVDEAIALRNSKSA